MQYGFYVGEKGKHLAVNTDNSLRQVKFKQKFRKVVILGRNRN
jgi:hypothetical protein